MVEPNVLACRAARTTGPFRLGTSGFPGPHPEIGIPSGIVAHALIGMYIIITILSL